MFRVDVCELCCADAIHVDALTLAWCAARGHAAVAGVLADLFLARAREKHSICCLQTGFSSLLLYRCSFSFFLLRTYLQAVVHLLRIEITAGAQSLFVKPVQRPGVRGPAAKLAVFPFARNVVRLGAVISMCITFLGTLVALRRLCFCRIFPRK